MDDLSYQLFFRVVDHCVIKGNLILVSDRTDSGRARALETIQVKDPNGTNARFYTAGCVSYWQMPGAKRAPFCMAIQGVTPEEIPIGSTVWLESREITERDFSRYCKLMKMPEPTTEERPEVSQAEGEGEKKQPV